MIGIVLALFAALAFGFSVVLIRKKIDESNFFFAALVLTVTGNIILWPLAFLFTDLRTFNFEGVLLFAVAGILAPGIARLGYYKGMEVVGVSVNASIFAAYPMYSSILAVLFLGEVLTPEKWIGIVCIVVGVVYVERGLSNLKTGSERISKKGLAFPILASLAIALSQIVRKHGLNIYNQPLLGVAIGYSSTLLLYVPLLISSNTTRGFTFSVKDFRMFWKAGVGMSLGWILSFYALSHENVSIVAPLLQTEPLFILFFVYLYLEKLEHISFKLVISTLLIVMGAMLVGIS
jgi:DME family drug/metabolite transporter